ncbi:MAG: serine/threonine protein kinase, partial [Holophagales bacterium]|nr:serine/threonine protein kinase [Holophagales bacterium]
MDDRDQAFPTRIGPYRIEKELGTGGMGTVYRAFHQVLARPVALKRVRPDSSHQRQLRERFVREARAAARLSHPNIVHIYDILEHEGEDWIVMELAEGVTLDQLVKEGPLAIDRGLTIARDVVLGLSAAHGRKIVHRDLKCENVVVGSSGHAKILDFGLAKVQDLYDDADLSSEGRLLGTARAMSPEQIQGDQVDHRSDLFSLGTLLYEMFSGISPFQGPAMVQTLMRIHNHTQPALAATAPEIPQELSDLVDRLLEK